MYAAAPTPMKNGSLITRLAPEACVHTAALARPSASNDGTTARV